MTKNTVKTKTKSLDAHLRKVIKDRCERQKFQGAVDALKRYMDRTRFLYSNEYLLAQIFKRIARAKEAEANAAVLKQLGYKFGNKR